MTTQLFGGRSRLTFDNLHQDWLYAYGLVMATKNYERLYKAKAKVLAETASLLSEIKKSEKTWKERAEDAEAISLERLKNIQWLTVELGNIRSRFNEAERERLADEAEIAFWAE